MAAKADRHTIWRQPIYLPYCNDPLTPRMIRAAERRLGQRLPRDYLDLLAVQNGGYIAWELKDMCHEMICGIGKHFPHLGVQDWDVYEVESLRGLGNQLIPFDGDGHWMLCFDYRERRSNPHISYVDTESLNPSIEVMFEDFVQYLTRLKRPGPEGRLIIGIRDPMAAHDLVRELGQRCKLPFSPEPDVFCSGYPIYSAWEQRGEDHYRINVSPNLVPRGFVRVDDYRLNARRFDRLRRLFPGSCYRYARHCDVVHILDASEKSETAMAEAVADMGLNHVVIEKR